MFLKNEKKKKKTKLKSMNGTEFDDFLCSAHQMDDNRCNVMYVYVFIIIEIRLLTSFVLNSNAGLRGKWKQKQCKK